MAGKKRIEDGLSAVEKMLGISPDAIRLQEEQSTDNATYKPIDKSIDDIIDKTIDNKTYNNNASNNIMANIKANIKSKEPSGVTYAFYLSADVAEQVKKTAKKLGISKSKLVDNILREVLLKG